MSNRITCEEFNAGLTDFALGRPGAADSAKMEEHLALCAGCREIFEVKKALFFDPENPEDTVPEEVVQSLRESVLAGVAAAGEAGRPGRSWASRYMMPAMVAAIVLFVFLSGFMLSEIRTLHSENGELRKEVAVIEMALAGRIGSGAGIPGGRSIFGRLTGGLPQADGRMTIGEVARFLEALPNDTPVLGEMEAEELIAGNRRLRRLAGYMEDRPWEGGLTSKELLIVIVELALDPETRIPDDWHETY